MRGLRLALLALACIVYAGIALTSPGYDDEFYNIALLGHGAPITAVLGQIAHWDVHPPGQYLIDWALFGLLGSWPLVRAVAALFCAAVVWRFAGLERRESASAVILQFLLVVLHPALLMWCTGLRWTSWFVPLFLIAILWVRRNEPAKWRFWPVLALLSLGLFYLNYLALLLAPLLVLYALYQRRERLRTEWTALATSLVVAALAALPQLYILLHFQIGQTRNQTSSALGVLPGLVQGLIVHVGVFPLSIIGAITFLVFAGLTGWIALRRREAITRDPELWLAGIALLALCLTGLAGKWRNLVPLVPLVFAKFVPAIERNPARLALALAWILALSNVAGAINVARHAATNKGSWNLPAAETVAAVRAATASCGPAKPVVAIFDPVLAATVAQQTGVIVIPSHPKRMPAPMAQDGDWCLFQLKTYRGAIPARAYAGFQAKFPASGTTLARIGPDSDIAAKRRIDPQMPDHYVELVCYGRMARVPDYLGIGAKLQRAGVTELDRPFE